MSDRPRIRVLLVEDNPTDVLLLREVLAETVSAEFALTHVERLADALARLRAEPVDVILLDLGLPDSSGADTLAKRLQTCLRQVDTVARLGGDEFVIVLEDLPHEELAVTVAHKVLKALETPFWLEGHEFFLTASLGITLFPRDGDNADKLLLTTSSTFQSHASRLTSPSCVISPRTTMMPRLPWR